MSIRRDIPSALFLAFAVAFIISHLTTAFSDLLVSTLLDKMEGGWLRVSFVCHLICRLFVSFVSRISFVYLLSLIPLLASTPYS